MKINYFSKSLTIIQLSIFPSEFISWGVIYIKFAIKITKCKLREAAKLTYEHPGNNKQNVKKKRKKICDKLLIGFQAFKQFFKQLRNIAFQLSPLNFKSNEFM